MGCPNQNIVDALSTIADSYKNQGVLYKYKAYRIAIDTIKSLPNVITSSAELKGMKGIGKSMLEKIDEMVKTGALEQEKAVLSDPIAAALKVFTSVHGIGAKLADKLVHEHGLRTLEELEDATHLHLPSQVRMGLKHYKDSQLRIPYAEVRTHFHHIESVAHRMVDKNLILNVCGSHRRGAETSGDVDVLMSHPHSHSQSTAQCTFLKHLVEALRTEGYVVDTLVEGPSKFMGYCKLKHHGDDDVVVRRLDLRWMPYDSYWASLLYFTGSDMFNVSMRTEALKLGYSINEYGIYKLLGGGGGTTTSATTSPGGSPSKTIHTIAGGAVKGDRVEVHSEEDIFKVLGMAWVDPKQRCK